MELIGQRRRGNGFGQNSQTRSLAPQVLLTRAPHRVQEITPASDPPVQDRYLGTVRIVEGQRRGLREDVRRAQAGGVLGIALDFGRAAHVAFNQHSGGESAERHGGRVEERLAGNDFLRGADVRNDLLRRQLGAGGEAGEGRRGAHQFQKIAPAKPIQFVGRFVRGVDSKLVVQEILVLLGFGQFFQTPPEPPDSVAFQLRSNGSEIEKSISAVLAGHRVSCSGRFWNCSGGL